MSRLIDFPAPSTSDFKCFTNEKITSIDFYGWDFCLIHQENGYHFRCPFIYLKNLLRDISFSSRVSFNVSTLVPANWFFDGDFWKRALHHTSMIYIHGRWNALALDSLLSHFSSIQKICFTYWECDSLNHTLPIIASLNCRDIVIDLRGIKKKVEYMYPGIPYLVKGNVLEILKILPCNLYSLVLIFSELFESNLFREIQKIVKTKMSIGAQAVLLFNGEFECIHRHLIRGSLYGFGFRPIEPCHIVSYNPSFLTYSHQKNMDAFKLFCNLHHGVSYVVGAKVTVESIYETYPVVVDVAERIPINILEYHSTDHLSQVHQEIERMNCPINIGRKGLTYGQMCYTAPENPGGRSCCIIRDINHTNLGSRGKEYSYGLPLFRKERVFDKWACDFQSLLENPERINEIVYFFEHTELHLDNGLISCPGRYELQLFRITKASEHLIVHSETSTRFTIEGIGINELLTNVKSIEFRGGWWGRLIHEFISRRDKSLKKFNAFCFQSQRSGLLEFFRHHGGSKIQVHPTFQFAEISFDARDCIADTLFDVLKALQPRKNDFDLELEGQLLSLDPKEKVAEYQKITAVVSKVISEKDYAKNGRHGENNIDFLRYIGILLRYTERGGEINLAILNQIPLQNRNQFTYIGANYLTGSILCMTPSGTTILPQMYDSCFPDSPDLALKIFTSEKFNRKWTIAIPFDSI